MTAIESLDENWRIRKIRPFHAKPVISDHGIVFGAGTILVRGNGTDFHLARDASRAISLVSIAQRQAALPGCLYHFEKAATAWSRGDKAIAQFHLSYAQISPLADIEDAKRLFLAETLLETGIEPLQLAKMVGIEGLDFAKQNFNASEPRNPKNDGEESGRWTKETYAPNEVLVVHLHRPKVKTDTGSGQSRSKLDVNAPAQNATNADPAGWFPKAPYTPVVPPTVEPLAPSEPGLSLLENASRAISRLTSSLIDAALSSDAMGYLTATGRAALSASAATPIAAAFAFGFVFLRTTNSSLIEEGPIANAPGLRFSRDGGGRSITISSDTDPNLKLRGFRDRDGIYKDPETRRPVARSLDDGIVMLDPSLLAQQDQPKEDEGGSIGPRNTHLPDEPKLCPRPVKDLGGSPDPFPSDYEQFIRELNNPQRKPQLPKGLTFGLYNPQGELVHYDDCRESDGTMIEAKSDRSRLIFYKSDLLERRYLKQARSEHAALGNRRLEWYFHSKPNADFARELFAREHLDKITVYFVPYPGEVPPLRPRARRKK